MFVCKEEDDYVRDRFESNTRWIAKLSNGERIFQDDYRPGVEPYSAWLRLKDYVEQNKLAIEDLIVQFRSNVIQINHEKVDGFFFRNAVLGGFGLRASDLSLKTIQYFIVGTIKNGILSTVKYQVPELQAVSREQREINKDSLESIIYNNYG